MKKLTALLLAIAMMVTCTLCAVAEDGKTYMAVCIASEPDTLDPALNSAVDGATMVAHLFAGLSTWAQTDDGKLEILPDCAVELPDPVVNDDGTVTYTYTLVDGLKWSDGKDLTAKDSSSRGSALLPPSWARTMATCLKSSRATLRTAPTPRRKTSL